MPFKAETDARLLRPGRAGLPLWCDHFLAPPGSGDIFSGRAWYDTVLGHALPPGAEPVLAVCGANDEMLVPLLRQGGRLRSMVTPYSLEWRALPARGADTAALRDAGRGLAQVLRGSAPIRLEAMDPAAPGMAAWLAGLRHGGMALGPFRHFGNWRQVLEPGAGWAGYLAARPPTMRNTIQRKLARAAREFTFVQSTAPGAGLERGIADFVAVRGRSWKPEEPFPHFDAALLRAMAAIGALRLGVLRGAGDVAVAAQYWLVDGGRAHLLKLVHDEAAAAASPGTALTALMIRALIENDAVAELDFGRGDDAYKRLWVTERRQRVGMMVTDPWHPAGLIELARQGVSRGRRLLRGAGWKPADGDLFPPPETGSRASPAEPVRA